MKPPLPTNEESLTNYLEPAKEVSLTEAQRALMKSELLAYADFHRPQTSTTKPVAKTVVHHLTTWTKVGFALASLVLVSVTTGYASIKSEPGDSLYAVKVDVVEPIVGLVQFTEYDKLAYEVSLMERRLEEVQALVRDETLSSIEVDVIERQVMARMNSINALLEEDTDQSITDTQVLESVLRVHAIVETQAVLTDYLENGAEESVFEDIADDAADLYTEEVDIFIATASTTDVGVYLRTVLEDVEESIARDTDLATTSAAEIESLLDEATNSVTRNELDEAIRAASEAHHLLNVEEYLDEVRNRFEVDVTEDLLESVEILE